MHLLRSPFDQHEGCPIRSTNWKAAL